MTSIETVEASADTQAATGITHYVFDAIGGWKAFGANDAEIATLVVPKEAPGEGVLRVDTHGQRAEITYSIEHDNNKFIIDAVVNGIPSKVTFSKDGGLIGEGFSKTVDPAINEIFRSINRDLMAHRGARSQDAPRAPREKRRASAYCGGLGDAADSAEAAGEWFAAGMLNYLWTLQCI